MLTFDVKRKINTLRDILVGKVPDPKAQVEQITIALIYKFMDDMDIEGLEFGGTRQFFTGEYEKYAWTEIMKPENSGQQRAFLYAEGIEKMATNPNLPQLFRDIFRGAYIPYRDPDMLNVKIVIVVSHLQVLLSSLQNPWFCLNMFTTCSIANLYKPNFHL